MHKYIYICSILVFLIAGPSAFGQGVALEPFATDTLRVEGGSWLEYRDTVVFIPRDTQLLIPKSSQFEFVYNVKSESFYDSLERKLKRNGLTAKLHGFIFKQPEYRRRPAEKPSTELARTAYTPYEGQTIRSVTFHQVDLMEGNVYDTSRQANSWVAKTLNNLHISTREDVLRQYLQFQAGETVNPDLMADTERLLRSLNYIENVHIMVTRDTLRKDFVDVHVITKDRFSIGADASVSQIDRFRMGVYDNNFLGRGIEISTQTLFDDRYSPALGYRGNIVFNNLGNSLLSLEVDYQHTSLNKELNVRFNRGMLTPEMKYSGGAHVAQTSRFRNQLASDGISVLTSSTGNYLDFWFGRSFKLDGEVTRKNLSISARYVKLHFADRPEVGRLNNLFYHNRELFIANLHFLSRKFYRSKNFTGFGDTEDIPTGIDLGVTAGYERAEFFERPYLGMEATTGFWFGQSAYLGLRAKVGGFLRDQRVEDGFARLQTIMFTDLVRLNKFRFRQIVNFRYVRGIRRSLPTDQLSLRSNLSHFPNNRAIGTKKMALNLESVLFAPWCSYGFKTAFFTFADLGYITNDGPLVRPDNFFTSVGVGIRLRNRSLIFDTFELRLAYIPRVVNENTHWFPDFRDNDPNLFLNLTPTKPGIPEFTEVTNPEERY